MSDVSGTETTVPVEAIAKLVGDTETIIRKLSRTNVLPRIEDGRIPLSRTIQQYSDYLRRGLVTIEQAGEAMGLSASMAQRLVTEGYIKRDPDGGLRRIEAMLGYIRFLKDEGRRANKSAAESRVRDARAKDIEDRIAIRRRDLIPIEDAEAAMAALCAIVRSVLDGMPARASRDRAVRPIIQKATDDALTAISDRAAEISAALEAGHEVLTSDTEDIA